MLRYTVICGVNKNIHIVLLKAAIFVIFVSLFAIGKNLC